jgi:hypothetical protein
VGPAGHGVRDHQVWPDAVVLRGRGITIHGATVRQARGSRKARLRAFEAAFRKGYRPYHGHSPALTLDSPIPVAEIEAGRSWMNDGDKIANLRAKLRGRATVTARELLVDCRDVERAAGSLAYLVRDLGRAEREAQSAAERQPVHCPLASYCDSMGSIRWLRGNTASGPWSMPQSSKAC